ncbi:ATP-binding protein [Clostridium sp. 'deep sea']|uniref:ATP-binding protein n=1 Tax=Clostridium sp. 'deep sea' TaxID=2779445 RepID=UPI0018965EFA|nr:ATP-binding protein [Clostridium sp. 'deep sea']QOR36371.1 ATP-binding protein [Clostridium sp. 'deep sea']
MKITFPVASDDFVQAGEASSKIKRVLKQIGIPSHIIRKVAIATYESEMNIVIHAYEGELTLCVNADEIKVVAEDKGPGIADLDLAMQEGFSTASEEVRRQGFGAGMGLPNIKKSCGELHINTKVGTGTTVSMHFNLTESEG